MKRDEMVALGRDIIATYCYHHNIEDLEENDYFNLSNNILGHFEAEGMLPPAYEENSCPDEFKGTRLESSYVGYIRDWEKND